MTRITVPASATIDLYDVLAELDDDDMIEELVQRGYKVDGKADVEIEEEFKKSIRALHRSFVASTPEQFQADLKAFFLKEIDEYVR